MVICNRNAPVTIPVESSTNRLFSNIKVFAETVDDFCKGWTSFGVFANQVRAFVPRDPFGRLVTTPTTTAALIVSVVLIIVLG